MTDDLQALFVHRGKAVSRADLTKAIEQELGTASDQVVEFAIKPLAPDEEMSRVIDRLAQVAADNQCNGTCD